MSILGYGAGKVELFARCFSFYMIVQLHDLFTLSISILVSICFEA